MRPPELRSTSNSQLPTFPPSAPRTPAPPHPAPPHPRTPAPHFPIRQFSVFKEIVWNASGAQIPVSLSGQLVLTQLITVKVVIWESLAFLLLSVMSTTKQSCQGLL